MSPRSFDRTPLAGFRAFALIAALVAPLLAGPASAKLRGTIHVAGSDTTRVKEITIDDEGIRIVGDDKTRVLLPGDVDLDRHGVRIHRVMIDSDSMPMVTVHSGGDNEIVQFFKDVHVEKGQNVSQVVAILGNVKNDGVISGDCVAIMGSIVQGDSAVIQGEAVTIGGAVRSAGKGARVEGETVSIGFLPFAGFAVPSVSLLLLFGLLSLLLYVGLAALTGRLFPERLARIADTISKRSFLSLMLGLLSIPLAFIVGLLLMVTVIGIPLAFLLPFLFILAAFVGYTAAVYLLGSKLLGRRPSPEGGMIGPIAAGTALVTLFYAIGVPLMSLEGTGRVFGFGFLLLWLVIGTVCWMMGLGALLLSRIGQEPASATPRGSQWAPAAPPSPPAPPPIARAPGDTPPAPPSPVSAP
jgi:ketosteroid isomerase-like protein